MKKYVILSLATAVMIAAIALTGHAVKQSIVCVETVRMAPRTAEDTVTCTGKVESYPGNSLYAVTPGIIRKIYVKEGEQVSSGQAIMDIVPLASDSSSSALSASSSSDAYEAAYAAYLRAQSPNSSSSSALSLPSGDASEEKQSSKYTLFAGNAGTVESLASGTIGSYIDTSSPAAVIRNDSGMLVRLSVDESQAADLKQGQKVQFSGAGFKNSTYFGVIKSIALEAKQTVLSTGQETVVEAVASVDKPGDDMKPGYTAKAKITTLQNARVLCAPYDAVREDAEGNEYVFLAVNGKAKKTGIVTGKEFDDGFEVKKGLKNGDLVITNPDDVTDGGQVAVTGELAGGNG